eukprot:m.106536 g.106536  ORF g.106536 m.106536 type:complete len:103 (-) comp16906_c0_seq2:384-692(-)
MAQAGATLQGLNNEMVSCLEELRGKRENINQQILVKQEERLKIQNELHILSERLARISDDLTAKVSARDQIDEMIAETEAAYMKILESSQALLSVLQREAKR